MEFVAALWFMTTLTLWLGGLIYGMVEPIHHRRPFSTYYRSWGSYRFYTLAVPVYTLLVPFWFLVILYFYIVGIVKKK